ncbi:hypothetical protein EYD45_13995 [Hyunsoonleella flava]|uniref:Uncharacterized protein n=1 Tax=Hyunsoonleella flava TaxID=2527939 RepID=A0A4Q9FHJ9_9FLAO|nr:hypothetical protein [Hyunsoonleella flava]TBN00930.1 hypothetical protein EYD45_13995 [Hyunsoonleella flava]
MKKILLFGFIIVSINLHSQIMTRYFIEGVEIVDYVTLEICADSINGINNVELIAEKTTHKNQANIDQLVNYIKSFDYPKDGPLIGRCGNLAFSFMNPEFENLKLNENEIEECSKFRLGNYSYHHINHQDTKIKRRKKMQKEKSYKSRQIYSINWTSNSTYTLTYKRMSDDNLKNLIGEKIEVEILKLLDNDGYVYRSTSPKGIVYYGAIYKSKK